MRVTIIMVKMMVSNTDFHDNDDPHDATGEEGEYLNVKRNGSVSIS